MILWGCRTEKTSRKCIENFVLCGMERDALCHNAHVRFGGAYHWILVAQKSYVLIFYNCICSHFISSLPLLLTGDREAHGILLGLMNTSWSSSCVGYCTFWDGYLIDSFLSPGYFAPRPQRKRSVTYNVRVRTWWVTLECTPLPNSRDLTLCFPARSQREGHVYQHIKTATNPFVLSESQRHLWCLDLSVKRVLVGTRDTGSRGKALCSATMSEYSQRTVYSGT